MCDQKCTSPKRTVTKKGIQNIWRGIQKRTVSSVVLRLFLRGRVFLWTWGLMPPASSCLCTCSVQSIEWCVTIIRVSFFLGLFSFKCIGMFCLNVCTSCAVLSEAWRGHQIPWNNSYAWLWVSTCVIRTKPWSSVNATGALNHEPPLYLSPVILVLVIKIMKAGYVW